MQNSDTKTYQAFFSQFNRALLEAAQDKHDALFPFVRAERIAQQGIDMLVNLSTNFKKRAIMISLLSQIINMLEQIDSPHDSFLPMDALTMTYKKWCTECLAFDNDAIFVFKYTIEQYLKNETQPPPFHSTIPFGGLPFPSNWLP